jgi:hypothetical protein
MAVHKYFISFIDEIVSYLCNVEKFLKSRVCEIFPKEVEVGNAIVHQSLRCVREPNLLNDSISAIRMLSWLLKIKYCCYILPE